MAGCLGSTHEGGVYNASRAKRIRMGGPGMPGARYPTRSGVERAALADVQKAAVVAAGPGSTWSIALKALGTEREASSQTLRQGALEIPESSPWLVMAPAWPMGIAGKWAGANAAVALPPWSLPCTSSRQAFAIPEANAKSHPSNTMIATFRLARVLEKSFMLDANYVEFMLSRQRQCPVDLCQAAASTGDKFRSAPKRGWAP